MASTPSLSLAARIREADDLGLDVDAIAELYSIDPRRVRRVLWEKDNWEHRRKWDRERKQKLYMDPDYRAMKQEAMRLVRKRRKERDSTRA